MNVLTMPVPVAGGPVTLPEPQSIAEVLRRIRKLLDRFGVNLLEERFLIGLDADPWFGGGPSGPSPQEILDLVLDCRGSLTLAFDDDVVDSSTSPAALGTILVKARATGVRLALSLEKSELLKAYGVEYPTCWLTLFFCGQALINELARPMAYLESGRGVFEHATGERKTMILVVEDRDLLLEGPYLAVLGGNRIADWRRHCPAQPPDPAPIRELHGKVLDPAMAMSWIGFYLKHLTPIQLAAQASDFCAEDPVVQAFHRKRIELVAVYTANQTREIVDEAERRSELLCRYQGDRSSGDLLLGKDGSAAESLAKASDVLGELSKWIYTSEARETDRLTVLRNVFANQLGYADAEANYRFLVNEAGRLDRCVRNSWQTFVEEKLSAYFDRVQQIEELIDRTAESFRGHLQTLIKSMSENMLAGVGVVIASLVAAMFGSEFKPEVFQFGLFLYAGYLLIFPGLIGFSSVHAQAKEAEGICELKVDSFRSSAPRELVEDVLSRKEATVENARARFYRWLWATAGVYIAAITALLLGGWLVT